MTHVFCLLLYSLPLSHENTVSWNPEPIVSNSGPSGPGTQWALNGSFFNEWSPLAIGFHFDHFSWPQEWRQPGLEHHLSVFALRTEAMWTE